MRSKLKKARQDAGLTQNQVAAQLGVSVRYYRFIEAGERDGDFAVWDELEDLLSIHQRILRERSADQIIK